MFDQFIAVVGGLGQGSDLFHDGRIPGNNRSVHLEGEVGLAADGRPLQAVLQEGRLGENHLQAQLKVVQLLFRQGLVFDLETEHQLGKLDQVDLFDERLDEGTTLDLFHAAGSCFALHVRHEDGTIELHGAVGALKKFYCLIEAWSAVDEDLVGEDVGKEVERLLQFRVVAGGLELAQRRVRIGGLHGIQAETHLDVRQGLDLREGPAVDDGVELLPVAEHDRAEGGVGRHDIQRWHRLGGQCRPRREQQRCGHGQEAETERHFSTEHVHRAVS